MKIKVFFFFLFFNSLISAQQIGKVIGIKDGDTIIILLNGKQQKTLRLAEVDCPEKGQPFGKNAKEFTSKEIFGKTVVFYETDIDRYGRTIAKVYYNGNKYLSKELIKNGLGWWYFQYSNNKLLGKLQDSAKRKKVGLWQEKNAIPPYKWRKLHKKREGKLISPTW